MLTRKELLKRVFVLGAGLGLYGTGSQRIFQALAASTAHTALYWSPLGDNGLQCELCPRKCTLENGQRGFCGARENNGGSLRSMVYAEAAAVHVDPMEKKPLFHFLPATTAFSIATAGCNLRCKFCQNWEISQSRPEDIRPVSLPAQEVVKKALESGSRTIAYTYTEPTIFYEYMQDTALIARASGLRNIMHSAGFINEGPLRNICGYLDAANIDLKSFSQEYYAKICSGTLEDVLRTLKIIRQEKVHLEITNLVVPGLNDSDEEIRRMCLWIKENLGPDTPLHFSRFWPMYKLSNLAPTPVATLEKAREIARKVGIRYAYIGNVPGHEGETTFCPGCGQGILVRIGYTVSVSNMIEGRCKYCQEKIAGVWS